MRKKEIRECPIENKLLGVWRGMKRRCYNKNFRSYCNYGGRGIKISSEWLDEGPEPFIHWALCHGYSQGLDLDRIDNDGPYSPQNCRFVTREKNLRNTRRNVFLKVNGAEKCISDWASVIKMNPQTISSRIKKYGIRDAEEYIEKKINGKFIGKIAKPITINGKTMSMQSWSKFLGHGTSYVHGLVKKHGLFYTMVRIKQILYKQSVTLN